MPDTNPGDRIDWHAVEAESTRVAGVPVDSPETVIRYALTGGKGDFVYRRSYVISRSNAVARALLDGMVDSGLMDGPEDDGLLLRYIVTKAGAALIGFDLPAAEECR
jgi:hypothetical protein